MRQCSIRKLSCCADQTMFFAESRGGNESAGMFLAEHCHIITPRSVALGTSSAPKKQFTFFELSPPSDILVHLAFYLAFYLTFRRYSSILASILTFWHVFGSTRAPLHLEFATSFWHLLCRVHLVPSRRAGIRRRGERRGRKERRGRRGRRGR